MNKKILLLGGNGYIGCAVRDHLDNLNYDVTDVDLCWYGKIYSDTIVKNYSDLDEQFLQQFSHVILLAAHSTVGMCNNNFSECFENNVLNYIKLLEKLSDEQIFIYSSTAAVYGNNDNLVDETVEPQKALNFYDYTKLCNEQIAELYPNKQIVGLRFGSVGGFSKNFRNENLLNSLSVSAKNNKKITVSNPEKMRSILGMKDLCRAMICLIEGGNPKNRVYNWSSVNGKILDFGNAIQTLTKCEFKVDDSFSTNYSFNCSNKLFEEHYKFKFEDTIDSIYSDVILNYDKVMVNVKRGKQKQ